MTKSIIESKYSKGDLKFLITIIIVLTAILGIFLYALIFSSKYLDMDFFPYVFILFSLIAFSTYHLCTSFVKITIYENNMVINNQLTGSKKSIAFSELRGYSFGSINENDLSKTGGITFFMKDGNIYIGTHPYENFKLFIEPVITYLKNQTEEHAQKLRRRYWLKIGTLLLIFIVYSYGLVGIWNWTWDYVPLGMKDYVSMRITLNGPPSYTDPDGDSPYISLPNDELPDFDYRTENELSSANLEALMNKKAGEQLFLWIPKRAYDIKVKGTTPGSFGEKNYQWHLIDLAGVSDENTVYLNAEDTSLEYRPNRPDLLAIFLLTMYLLIMAAFYLVYQRSRFVKYKVKDGKF